MEVHHFTVLHLARVFPLAYFQGSQSPVCATESVIVSWVAIQYQSFSKHCNKF